MGLQTRMGDDGVSVTVAEAMTDCDELFEDRNTLAVALRSIVVHGSKVGIDGTAWKALEAVFPDDPLGEQALYDCADADGRNRLREELDAD